MKRRGEAHKIEQDSKEKTSGLDTAETIEVEVSLEAQTHVRVDGIPELDTDGNHIEGETTGESREMDFDYLNTKLIDSYINEIEPPEMGEVFVMARFKKSANTGSQTIGVPIPERFTFLTKKQVQEKEEAGEEVVYYEMKQVLGQGGMGMAVEAEAVNEHGEEIEGMDPIVVKLAFDMNSSVTQRGIVREAALHAVLNPDEESSPDLSKHLQAQYKGVRPRGKVKNIPAFEGAVKYAIPGGNVYATGMERIPGYDLEEYGLPQNKMQIGPAMRSMLPLTETLSDMHDRGILHRDLKPANIMGNVNHPENTKLIDMGISKDVFQEMIETADVSIREKVHEASFYEAKINQLLGEAGKIAPLDLKVKLEDEMVKFRKARDYKNVSDMDNALGVLEEIYGQLVEPGQQERVPRTDTSIPSQITQAGTILGTPYYMNTSVIRGESNPLNDVHALGASFLHMTNGARFNGSKKIHKVVDLVGKGEFINPYDLDSIEYEKLFRTEADREFAQLMYEMIKAPTPEYLFEPQQHLETGQILEDTDFFRIKEYLKWVKKGRVKNKGQFSGLEATLLAISEEIDAVPNGAPQKMRDDAEPLVREYFEQYSDWQLQQRGMHAVRERLSAIVEKKNKETGNYDVAVEAEEAPEGMEYEPLGSGVQVQQAKAESDEELLAVEPLKVGAQKRGKKIGEKTVKLKTSKGEIERQQAVYEWDEKRDVEVSDIEVKETHGQDEEKILEQMEKVKELTDKAKDAA